MRRSLQAASAPWLAEDLLNDPAVDVGQSVVAAEVGVGQPFVVDAQQVQNRGVQVVQMHLGSLRYAASDGVG